MRCSGTRQCRPGATYSRPAVHGIVLLGISGGITMPAKRKEPAAPAAAAPAPSSKSPAEAPSAESPVEEAALPDGSTEADGDEPEAAPTNRAERRARGKQQTAGQPTYRGKAVGAKGPAGSQRMWANRRSG